MISCADEGSTKRRWMLGGVFVNVETACLPLRLKEVSRVAHSTADIKTIEDCRALIAKIQGQPGYVQPMAYAVGIVRTSREGRALDTLFPLVNFVGENEGVAALLADQVGYTSGVMNAALTRDQIVQVIQALEPYRHDGSRHPNLEVLDGLLPLASQGADKPYVVVSFIEDTDSMPPEYIHDAYLRLHLLSHRKVQPHGVNLDGIFGKLPNNAWTDMGPMNPSDVASAQLEALQRGQALQVYGVDKFPRMTDYVIPSGVRIADADRVRLGAHLAEGTTVMHEGFCNFNAGTLGTSMVEGRISAGVVVGDGSDIGGGASIMGTLSGGGKAVISIGEGCLLGANAGLGISLGNRCTVEAGLYVTAGSKVTMPDGTVVKASKLSGRDDLLFRRDSTTGTIVCLPNEGADWGGLNTELHDNN